jgi:hypothetical protein
LTPCWDPVLIVDFVQPTLPAIQALLLYAKGKGEGFRRQAALFPGLNQGTALLDGTTASLGMAGHRVLQPRILSSRISHF